MRKRLSVASFVLLFAFAVLFVSVFRTAAVKYEIEGRSQQTKTSDDTPIDIDYQLAFPGSVLPDSPLWPVKALRDKVWLWVTTSHTRKAELLLLFSDKRLGSAKVLFGKGSHSLALSTLTKAEKYLEEASRQEEINRKEGLETADFLERIAIASLKHYQVMQDILETTPEEAKSVIIQYQNYAKGAYEDARNALLEKGKKPPENPFYW